MVKAMSHHAGTMPDATTRSAGRGAQLEGGAAHGIVQVLLVVVGVHLAMIAAQSDLGLVGRLNAVATVALLAVVALAASRSRRRVVRAGSAIALGVVGVAAGLGVAPAWLWVVGPSLTAVFATAGTVAAICLLAYGTTALALAIPGWWRLVVIPLGFLLVQFALIPLAGAVYGTHPPRTPMSAPMPEGAERVTFTTNEGVTHVAWYTPSRNGAAVVLLPGSGGDKGSTIAHGIRLARHGFGVLALDSRGTGESGGLANAWGWGGESDVRAAVDWLTKSPDVRRGDIGVIGLSMGGEIAITAAAADPRIAAVVAEGVSARAPGDLDYLPDDLIGTIQSVEARIMWAAELMTDATAPRPLVELVPAIESRLLIIVGNDPAEAAAAPRLTAAAPSLRTWMLPDTPHMRSLERHPDEWDRRVIGFLSERLDVHER
jgi:uncharacterized protein